MLFKKEAFSQLTQLFQTWNGNLVKERVWTHLSSSIIGSGGLMLKLCLESEGNFSTNSAQQQITLAKRQAV